MKILVNQLVSGGGGFLKFFGMPTIKLGNSKSLQPNMQFFLISPTLLMFLKY